MNSQFDVKITWNAPFFNVVITYTSGSRTGSFLRLSEVKEFVDHWMVQCLWDVR
jgi:hypothetical protein